MAKPAAPNPVSLADALSYWFKLGFINFGGPAGQIAMMHAELVERRRWISEQRFLHALNYCMLLPGPEATQLAVFGLQAPPARWDWIAIGISALASLALLRYKAGTIKLILACAAAGLVVSYLR